MFTKELFPALVVELILVTVFKFSGIADIAAIGSR